MPYKSRKRNYRSQRERLERSARNFRLVLIFSVIASAVWMFRSRYEIWSWLKTYFY